MALRKVLAAALLISLPCLAAAQQAQKKVLVLGDSHFAGPLGFGYFDGAAKLRVEGVDQGLRDRFGLVYSYAVCSASTHWWVSHDRPALSVCWNARGPGNPETDAKAGASPAMPDIDTLMSAPWDLVVIALGANSDGATSDDTITAGMLMLTKIPKAARCAWVGPPTNPGTGNRVDEFYRVFPQIVKLGGHACQLIDSRQFVNASQSSNGGHYYGAAGINWAKGVLGALAP